MRYSFLLLGSLLTGCVSSGSTQSNGTLGSAFDILNSDAGRAITQSLTGSAASTLSQTDISAGLREALSIGTQNVVQQVGVQNGFNSDSNIHIPLPGALGKVDSTLSRLGMGSLTDDLELRINRAAEQATPKAKELFITAIKQMTIADASNILQGPNDAATSYLRRVMGPGLSQEMQPIIQQTLADAGAIQAYDSVVGQYQQIPFVPDVKADLNNYVVGKAMDGIFFYVAQEEAKIRENPAARTTDLLRKVFASR